MSFRIKGLSPAPFVPLYGLSDAALAARGVIRYVADKSPGFPDRVEMRDATPGETVLLVNHVSQPADTPYRANHAIFVREGATRAFDAAGMMIDADVVEGVQVERLIARLFEDERELPARSLRQTRLLRRPDRAGVRRLSRTARGYRARDRRRARRPSSCRPTAGR